MSARRVMERVKTGGRLLGDGGIGSELIRAGVASEGTLAVNIRMPDAVRTIHERYLRAGAEIVTCNTFGLRDGSEWAGEVQAGAQIGLRAAREADKDTAVVASFPACIIVSELAALTSLALNARDWPDILLVETCISLDEAVAAARAAHSLAPGLLIVTAHFRANGSMPDGTLPSRLASALLAENVDIIGANCGDNPESFVEITRQMRAAAVAPILIQPSAGVPTQDADGQWRYPIDPEPFANNVISLFSAGANIVGGCCGTTPEHIAASCAALQR